jgi:hypothetical protein
MPRKLFALATLVAALTVSALPAGAAAPATATLSKSKRTVTWSGGPFAVSYPTTDVECVNGSSDSMCDHFMLKVNMGQGAKIKVSIVGSTSGLEVLQVLVGPNDFDLFIYGPDGNKVAESGSTGGREAATFTHKASFRNKSYEVRVVPYLVVPGATYKGAAATLKYVK